MVLKQIGAAVAGMALLMAAPASAGSLAAASTTVALQDSEDTDSGFERNLPLIVAVVFSGAFAYFLFDALNDRPSDEFSVSP